MGLLNKKNNCFFVRMAWTSVLQTPRLFEWFLLWRVHVSVYIIHGPLIDTCSWRGQDMYTTPDGPHRFPGRLFTISMACLGFMIETHQVKPCL